MADLTEQEVMVDTAIRSLQGLVKSKTAWGNVIGMPTVLLALKGLVTSMPALAWINVNDPVIIGLAYTVANLFFRFITKKPLAEK
jgi:hypothetical protein